MIVWWHVAGLALMVLISVRAEIRAWRAMRMRSYERGYKDGSNGVEYASEMIPQPKRWWR